LVCLGVRPDLRSQRMFRGSKDPRLLREDVSTVTAGVCGPTAPPFEARDAGNGYLARLWTGSGR